MTPQSPVAVDLIPKWDKNERVLSLGGKCVKQFWKLSRLQQCILDAFEEEGWATRIDDPLPRGECGRSPQDRLHDVITALNRNQEDARIYFYRDGTGEGIMWQLEPRNPKG